MSESLSAPASSILGVYSTSVRDLGGEVVETPIKAVRVDGEIYRFYRHPELYQNTRVRLFLKRMWVMRNNDIKPDLQTITRWELQAASIYNRFFDAAKQQKAQESKKEG